MHLGCIFVIGIKTVNQSKQNVLFFLPLSFFLPFFISLVNISKNECNIYLKARQEKHRFLYLRKKPTT
jgi:hypothetical protein